MRFMPLSHRSFQLMLLILSLYMVHAHYSELDATYAFNSQPKKQANTSSYNSYYNVIKALAWLGIKSICRIKLTVVSVHRI